MRVTFTKQYQHRAVEQWNMMLFADGYKCTAIFCTATGVRCSCKERYGDKYTITVVKCPSSEMTSGAMSVSGTAVQYFLPLKPL